eukprot:12919762-Prorocentrum_lima.AAC.1
MDGPSTTPTGLPSQSLHSQTPDGQHIPMQSIRTVAADYLYNSQWALPTLPDTPQNTSLCFTMTTW